MLKILVSNMFSLCEQCVIGFVRLAWLVSIILLLCNDVRLHLSCNCVFSMLSSCLRVQLQGSFFIVVVVYA
jgi:hypothetical protein